LHIPRLSIAAKILSEKKTVFSFARYDVGSFGTPLPYILSLTSGGNLRNISRVGLLRR
jgi:hypothetical protein